MGDHLRHHESKPKKEPLYPPGNPLGPLPYRSFAAPGPDVPHHDGYAVMTHMRIARWQRDISWLGSEQAKSYPINDRLCRSSRRAGAPG